MTSPEDPTETTDPAGTVQPVEVRATINLPGVSLGEVVRVDPHDPYMATCLERGYLVPR